MGGLFNGMAIFMQVLLDQMNFQFYKEGCLQVSIILFQVNRDKYIYYSCSFIISIKDLPYLDVVSLGAENAITWELTIRNLLKTLIISAVLISVSTALAGP